MKTALKTKDEVRTFSGTQVLNLLWSTCTAAVTSPTRVEGLKRGGGKPRLPSLTGVRSTCPHLPQPAGLGRPSHCASVSHNATWCLSPPHPAAKRPCKAWGGGLLGAPASPADREEVSIQDDNASSSQGQLADARTAVSSWRWEGGGRGAVTVPGLHSWLVTEVSCSWLLSQKGSCIHSSCDSTRRLPEPTLDPKTKPWQSALPRESLPGPPSSATLYSVCGGVGGRGGGYGTALPSSVTGEWTGRPAVPPLCQSPALAPSFCTIKTEASLRPIKGDSGHPNAKWLQWARVRKRMQVPPSPVAWALP